MLRKPAEDRFVPPLVNAAGVSDRATSALTGSSTARPGAKSNSVETQIAKTAASAII